MPKWDSMAAFGRDFDKMIGELTGPEKRNITRRMGQKGQDIAARRAAGDLGSDRAFSGWTRARPIPLDTRLRSAGDFNVMITPSRSSAGPWTVAEFGRNPSVQRRPRGRMSRARQKRSNGRTAGKRTATEAFGEMGKELPKVADKAVHAVVRKRFDVT